jgi:hypothetical protein
MYAPILARGTVYAAESGWVDQITGARQQLSAIGNQVMGRPVQAKMMDGHIYEGVVVGCDGCHMHLQSIDNRFFGPGAITTLVLYELLVLTLLI